MSAAVTLCPAVAPPASVAAGTASLASPTRRAILTPAAAFPMAPGPALLMAAALSLALAHPLTLTIRALPSFAFAAVVTAMAAGSLSHLILLIRASIRSSAQPRTAPLAAIFRTIFLRWLLPVLSIVS